MSKSTGLEITKVGLSTLDRKSLVNYLNDDKIVSKDTKLVDGIPSGDIAVSADGYDRETIKNALNLGGIDSSNFLLKGDVESLYRFAKEVSSIHMKEIRDIKDELYQTKAELNRRGYVKDLNLYHGINDTFNKEKIKYDDNSYDITNTIEDNTFSLQLEEGMSKDFYVGEQIAVVTETKKDTEKGSANVELNDSRSSNAAADISSVIYTIESINTDEIITKEPLMNIDSNNSKIFKTSGEYANGSFIYGKKTKNVSTGKERKTTFLDDINIRKRSIYKNGDGFAVRFKIDKILNGALKDFSIKAEEIGNAGSLECFIIKESDMNKFNNIEEVVNKNNSIIIARSTSYKPESKGLVKFSFMDSKGRYPILNVNDRERHCAIIVLNSENETDNSSIGRWEVAFSLSSPEGSDLYLHNNTYRFKNRRSHDLSPLENGIYVDPELKDYELNYILTSIETQEEGYEPFTEGIYTKKFKLHDSSQATNVRVSMRGNKESEFISESNVIIEKNTSVPIIVKKKNTEAFGDTNSGNLDFKIDLGDVIIIGDNPFIVKDTLKSNGQIKVMPINLSTEFVEIKKGDSVFRVDHRVFVRGCSYKSITDDNGIVKKVIDKEVILELPLAGSISDKFYNSKSSNNRIIFERDFLTEEMEQELPEELTDFEIQVVWRSKYSKNEIKNSIGQGFYGLIGRIDEITTSFNKAIYANNTSENINPDNPAEILDLEELAKWKKLFNKTIDEDTNYVKEVQSRINEINDTPEDNQPDINKKVELIKEFILYFSELNENDIIISNEKQLEIIKDLIERIELEDYSNFKEEFQNVTTLPQKSFKEAETKIEELKIFKDKVINYNTLNNKFKEIEKFIKQFESSEIVKFYIDDNEVLNNMKHYIEYYYDNKNEIETYSEASDLLDDMIKERNRLNKSMERDTVKINKKKEVLKSLLKDPALKDELDFIKDTTSKIDNISGSRLEQETTIDAMKKIILDKIEEMSEGNPNEILDKLIKDLEKAYEKIEQDSALEDDNTSDFLLKELKSLESKIKDLYSEKDRDEKEVKELEKLVEETIELFNNRGYKIIIKEYGKDFEGEELSEELQLSETDMQTVEDTAENQKRFSLRMAKIK